MKNDFDFVACLFPSLKSHSVWICLITCLLGASVFESLWILTNSAPCPLSIAQIASNSSFQLPTYKSESPSAIGAPPSFSPENLTRWTQLFHVMENLETSIDCCLTSFKYPRNNRICKCWDQDHSASSFCFNPDLDHANCADHVARSKVYHIRTLILWVLHTSNAASLSSCASEPGLSRAQRASWCTACTRLVATEKLSWWLVRLVLS